MFEARVSKILVLGHKKLGRFLEENYVSSNRCCTSLKSSITAPPLAKIRILSCLRNILHSWQT